MVGVSPAVPGGCSCRVRPATPPPVSPVTMFGFATGWECTHSYVVRVRGRNYASDSVWFALWRCGFAKWVEDTAKRLSGRGTSARTPSQREEANKFGDQVGEDCSSLDSEVEGTLRVASPRPRHFRDKNLRILSPRWAVDLYSLCSAVMRAFSSVGRALPLQGRCRGFESLNAHKFSFRTPQGSAGGVLLFRGLLRVNSGDGYRLDGSMTSGRRTNEPRLLFTMVIPTRIWLGIPVQRTNTKRHVVTHLGTATSSSE